MAPPDTVTLALWATNLSRPLSSLDDWAARVDARLADAKAAGARLLVMPEYACEQWLSFRPDGLPATQEIAWMGERAPDALERLRPLVARHGVGLLAGTMPWAVDGGFANRAWLLLPDGREIAHDKLVLTPAEMDPEGWQLETGSEIPIVDWDGMRLAPLVCLDVEMPAISVALARHSVDLLLVPSQTARLAGYSRVFGCARARAVELLCAVAATGCVGTSAVGNANVSGCAVFVPCEQALGSTGLHAEIAPTDGADMDDEPFLVARDIPLGVIAGLRAGGAEVWPGAWDAHHITIREVSR